MLLDKYLPSQYNGADYQGRRVYNFFGGGGGGGGGPTSSTVTQTNIPEYARPYVESMLGATMKEMFQTRTKPAVEAKPAVVDDQGNVVTPAVEGSPESIDITGFKDYRPFGGTYDEQGKLTSYDPSRGIATFSPEQQAFFKQAAALGPAQGFGQARNLADLAAQSAMSSAQAGYGYGGEGAQFGRMGAGIGRGALGYGEAGADIGQQGAEMAGMGFGAGKRYEQMATDPRAMQSYMSPYMQNVTDVQKRAAIRDYQENVAPQLAAQATRAGAFGGSRSALQKGVSERGLADRLAAIEATGTQQAFEQARQAQQFGSQLGLQGLGAGYEGLRTGMAGQQLGMQGIQGALAGTAQGMQGAGIGLQGVGTAQAGYGLGGQQAANLANIAGQTQAADISRLGFQGQAATQKQARDQAILNQEMQDYAMRQEYPRQSLSFMNAMLRGLPMQAPTTQSYAAAPSPTAQLGSMASILYGASRLPGMKKGGEVKMMDEGGIAAISRKVLMNPEKYSPNTIKQGIASGSVNPVIGNIAMAENADFARRAASGIDNLPVSDQMFSAAGGGIVAFNGEDGSQVQSPAGRRGFSFFDIQNIAPTIKSGFESMFPAEDVEAVKLRDEIRSKLGGKGGPYGAFKAQSDEQFARNKAIAQKLNTMKLDDLRQLNKDISGAASTPAAIQAAAYPDESKRGTASMTRPGGTPGIDLKRVTPPVAAAPAAAASGTKETPAKEPATTAETDFSKYKELLRQAGVSDDLFREDRETTKALREKLSKREKEAEGLAFIEAGLKGLGARNIGEMAEKMAPSVGTYARSKKELAAEEREIAGIDRDMRKAEDALKRGDVKTFMEFKDKAEGRAIQLRDVQAREKYYAKPTSNEYLAGLLGSSDPKQRAIGEALLGQAKTGAVTEDDIYRRWGEIQKDPAQMLALKKQGITSYEQFRALQMGAVRGVGGTGWGIRPLEGK